MLFADLYIEKRLQPAAQARVRLYADWLSKWGRDPQDRRCIDPPMVRRVVRMAKLRGWQPQRTGRPFWLTPVDVRYLQTPRHLLYAAPVVARVTVREITDVAPGRSVAHVRVMERMRGSLPGKFQIRVDQPRTSIPGDALAFLFPDEAEAGTFRCCPWFGGLFRISNGAALLYDDSGEERLWRFRPLQHIREELKHVQLPLEVPAELVDEPAEE